MQWKGDENPRFATKGNGTVRKGTQEQRIAMEKIGGSWNSLATAEKRAAES